MSGLIPFALPDATWHREDDTARSLGAFVTGSRAYGTPREDSDLDLVLLGGVDVVADLKAQGWREGLSASGAGFPGSTSLTREDCPSLNLIVCHNRTRFDSWLEGTRTLAGIAPVTREAAVQVFQALFAREQGAGGVA